MRPTATQLISAVRRAAILLGVGRATYCFEGRFRLPLAGDWALLISSDDAGRLRLEACLSGRVRATMWCLASDRERFAELVGAVSEEAAALVAA
jgi:hypothetical protein